MSRCLSTPDATSLVNNSSLVPVLFREAFSHPYISFFHLLVNVFCITSFRTFFAYLGGIGGLGGIKMASASTPSANEPEMDLILIHTVQLIPMIKTHFSGRMVSSGISNVAFASVHSEKTHLKKLIMIVLGTEKTFTSE